MAKGIYVGINTPIPIYEEDVVNNKTITGSDYNELFSVKNNNTAYNFAWNSSKSRFETNMHTHSTSNATSWTALCDMTISFDYGVSSESGYDEFLISLLRTNVGNVIVANNISGSETGSSGVLEMLTGDILQFYYAKDSSASTGDDCGYIENVQVSYVGQVITGYEYKDVARKVKKAYVGIKQFEPRELPEGYTQVQYIESNGGQYINTGFNPNPNTRITATISDWSSAEVSTTLWGTQSSSSDRYDLFINSSGVYRAYYGGSYVNFDSAVSCEKIVDIERNERTIRIGETSLTNTETSFANITSLYLFAHNNNGTPTRYSTLKLYSCQIYDNGTLVRDYVPCTNQTGVGGLYDLVNSKFYGNSGTGTFTSGASADSKARLIKKAYIGIGGGTEYREVEYIESSGTQYIDTGFKPNQDTRVILSAYNLSESSGWLFGAWDSNGTKQFASNAAMANNFRYGTQTKQITTLPIGNFKVELNKNKYNFNGAEGTLSEEAFSCSYNMYLFAINAGGSVSNAKFTGKVFKFEVYDNDTLVRDYVPAINSNGVAGLFDKVNGQFVSNAGSGNFAYGAETGDTHLSYGVARPCFGGGELAYYGTITSLSKARYNLAATTVGDYALFGGGNVGANTSNVVDVYNSSLTRSATRTFGQYKEQSAATTVGNYALFGGGLSGATPVGGVELYTDSLTSTGVSSLSTARYQLAATTVGNYALFGGGIKANGAGDYRVDAYNESLTRTTAPELSANLDSQAATTVGSYALFGGGNYPFGVTNLVDAYNTSLTKTTATSLSVARSSLSATTVGKYALFGGGYSASSVVDAYDTSLTRTTPTALSVARSHLAATTVNGFAIFFGGQDSNINLVDAVDVYDASLTRTIGSTPSDSKEMLAATTIGNYALFGGGLGLKTNYSATVDVYTVI